MEIAVYARFYGLLEQHIFQIATGETPPGGVFRLWLLFKKNAISYNAALKVLAWIGREELRSLKYKV